MMGCVINHPLMLDEIHIILRFCLPILSLNVVLKSERPVLLPFYGRSYFFCRYTLEHMPMYLLCLPVLGSKCLIKQLV